MTQEIEKFAQNPDLLIQLCRDVIDRIETMPEVTGTGKKEIQLQQISRAIEKLEKMGEPVPAPLRAELARMSNDLRDQSAAEKKLQRLANGLDQISQELRARFGTATTPPQRKKKSTKTSRSPKTDRKTLRKNIIETLKALGGSGRVTDVLQVMQTRMEDQFLPGDLEWRESAGEMVWQNNAKLERFKMVRDGILRKDAPRGYWQLSDETAGD